MDSNQRSAVGNAIFAIYLIFLLVGSIGYVSNGDSHLLLTTLSWGTIISFGLVLVAVAVGVSKGGQTIAY